MSKIALLIVFCGLTVKAGDLTLTDALSEAQGRSPRILMARSAADEAYWKKVEAYSGFLPTITAQGTYLVTHKYALTDVNLGTAPASVPSVIPTSNASLTAQILVFDGFANFERLSAGNALQRSAEYEADWTQFQVLRGVTLQFYKTLGAEVLKGVAEQNVRTLEDHLNDVKLFKRAGVSTNFDVLRVEVQVSEARSELLNAIDNVDIQRNKLAEILGQESDPRTVSGSLPVLSSNIVEKITDQELNQRKDIIAQQERTKALDFQDSATGRYWIPKLSVFGQYQYYNNRNDFIADFDKYRDAYNAGITLTWNIFDGMVSIAKSQQAAEQWYQSEKQLRLTQIKSKQDFNLWKRKYLYFCSIYQARLSDVEKSAESVRLAREGRKVGSRTNTDLLDAETELFRAKAGLVNSQIGSIEALVNLELAMGKKLYDFN